MLYNTFRFILRIPIHRPLPFLLGRSSYLCQRAIQAHLKVNNLSLTPEEVHLLMMAVHNEGSLVSDFARAVQRDRTTATRLIDSLEGHGLVVRVQDDKDRRSKRLMMTDLGRQTVMKILPIGLNLEGKLTDGISEEDMLVAISVLNRIQSACLRELKLLGFSDAEELAPEDLP